MVDLILASGSFSMRSSDPLTYPIGTRRTKAPRCRLLQYRRVRTLAETGDFHFADRSLHAQQQSIICESGVIDRFGVNQQRPDDAAKFQQGMPVPAIARQSRRLNAEDGADLPIA